MPGIKQKADESKFRIKEKNSTLEQICGVLDKVIDEFRSKKKLISFSELLTSNELYRSRMQWWCREYPDSAGARYEILQDIRDSRIESVLTTPKGSKERKLPPANIIFYSKVCGMIEHDKLLALDQDNAPEINLDINIGFDGDDQDDE